jgi:hypothetical protein
MSVRGTTPRNSRLSFGAAGSFFSGEASGVANGPRSLPHNMFTPSGMAVSGGMLTSLSTPSSESQGCGAQGLMASGGPRSTGATDGVLPGASGPCMSAPFGTEYSFDPAMSEGGLSRATSGQFDHVAVSKRSFVTGEASGLSIGGTSSITQTQNGGKIKRMKTSIKASFKKLFTRKKSAAEASAQAVSNM